MTPTQVLNAFDRACETLSMSRQAHIALQQIVQGLKSAITRDEAAEVVVAKARAEVAAQKDEPQEE